MTTMDKRDRKEKKRKKKAKQDIEEATMARSNKSPVLVGGGDHDEDADNFVEGGNEGDYVFDDNYNDEDVPADGDDDSIVEDRLERQRKNRKLLKDEKMSRKREIAQHGNNRPRRTTTTRPLMIGLLSMSQLP